MARLEIVSKINIRILLSQVTEIRSGLQRFAGRELNQLRGKKLASMLMDVFPEPLEEQFEIAMFYLRRERRNCGLGLFEELEQLSEHEVKTQLSADAERTLQEHPNG